MTMPKKLYAVNYKTGESIEKFNINNDFSQLRAFDYPADYDTFIKGKEHEPFLAMMDAHKAHSEKLKSIPQIENCPFRTEFTQLDPIMQKLVEKTGCMVFGDYIVYDKTMQFEIKKTTKYEPFTENCYQRLDGTIGYTSDITEFIKISISEVANELAKHYAGEKNRLEELLVI